MRILVLLAVLTLPLSLSGCFLCGSHQGALMDWYQPGLDLPGPADYFGKDLEETNEGLAATVWYADDEGNVRAQVNPIDRGTASKSEAKAVIREGFRLAGLPEPTFESLEYSTTCEM